MNEPSFATRLLGFALLLVVATVGLLLIGVLQQSVPQTAPTLSVVAAPTAVPPAAPMPAAAPPVSGQPEAPEWTPSEAPVAANQPEISMPVGECRATSEGYLATASTFGIADAVYTHADYWVPGQPERAVLLEGGVYERPPGAAGYWWSYTGACTADGVRSQVNAHMERRAGHGGWGDTALFTRVS